MINLSKNSGIKGFITGIVLSFILDILGVKNVAIKIGFLAIIVLIGYLTMFFINNNKDYIKKS